MMEALHSNGVRLVLVESLGRLARDLMVQETILHDLKRNDFDLISVAEPDLCSDDPPSQVRAALVHRFVRLETAAELQRDADGRMEGSRFAGSLHLERRSTEARDLRK
jgi:DNA invertase Pin-like site-specific DNA recombinase